MSFPDDSEVEVRYPLTPEQEAGDRAAWPWLPGRVVQQCGPDEWQICVQAPELAIPDDATRRTRADLCRLCFREIDAASPVPKLRRRCRRNAGGAGPRRLQAAAEPGLRPGYERTRYGPGRWAPLFSSPDAELAHTAMCLPAAEREAFIASVRAAAEAGPPEAEPEASL